MRPDGYHNLFSLVIPIEGKDKISLKIDPNLSKDALVITPGPHKIENIAFLSANDDNTILKAIDTFRLAHRFQGHCKAHLIKNTPLQSGLGGGSSNGALTLLELNRLLGNPLPHSQLLEIAKGIGADIPLFIQPTPTLMEGIGEILSPAPNEFLQALQDTSCLIFKPGFGISTPEAYAFLKTIKGYTPINDRKQFLKECLHILKNHGIFLNDFLRLTKKKYPIILTLLKHINSTYKLPVGMSGSGSACFAILSEKQKIQFLPDLIQEIQNAFGENAFYQLSDWVLPPNAL